MNDGGDNQKTTEDHFFVAWFHIFAVEDVLVLVLDVPVKIGPINGTVPSRRKIITTKGTTSDRGSERYDDVDLAFLLSMWRIGRLLTS